MKKLTFILFSCFAFVGLSAMAQSDTTKASGISLRGGNKSNNALIIIDGNKQYIRGSELLKQLNPENIQSIQIIRDTAGFTQYGADAMDGVILITTKTGKLNLSNSIKIENNFELKNYQPIQHSTIITRTQNSKNNKPLYILDGNLIENGAINSINPNTIDSIKILKGIEATNLYGESGNNGVILIKTKIVSKSKN